MTGRAFDDHISREELLSGFRLPTIFDLITQKRMRWIGHALRRKDGDKSKIAVRAALEDTGATWTKQVKEDCRMLGIMFGELEKQTEHRSKYRSIINKERPNINELSSSGNKNESEGYSIVDDARPHPQRRSLRLRLKGDPTK